MYKDADAALDFILKNETMNNKDVFVLGFSLGGAVAIDLASRRRGEVRTFALMGALWGMTVRKGTVLTCPRHALPRSYI